MNATPTAETPEVQVGQVWADNDKRVTPTRYVRVLEIGDSRDPFKHHVIRKARCEAWYDKPGAKSRTVHIDVTRFRPTATGYRFVSSPVEGNTTGHSEGAHQ